MTPAWIVTDGALWKKTPEIRRSEIRAWLSMHGIEATRIPMDSEILVHEDPDGVWIITFEEFRTDARGRIMSDPDDRDQAYVRLRSVPVDLDPPLYWLTEKVEAPPGPGADSDGAAR